jgi:chitodextrinase
LSGTVVEGVSNMLIVSRSAGVIDQSTGAATAQRSARRLLGLLVAVGVLVTPSVILSAGTTVAGAASPPTAPTNLHETAQTRTSVSLAWTAPTSTGGSTITHYLVFRTGTLVATLGSTTLSDTVTGLAGGTTYHFRVKAETAVATSPASNTLAVTTAASAPSAPTALHGTAQTRTSVSLAWTAPSSTGGSPITHYLVYGTGSLVVTVGPSTLGHTVTGLARGTTYHFTVRAENAVGDSPASNTLAVTTTATPPSAPSNLHETGKTHTSVSLAWTAPSTTGGSTITNYLVYGTGSPVATFAPSASSDTVTGLTGGTHYVFTVKAENAIGTSPASNTEAVTTTTSPPVAPTNLRETAKSQTTVALAWTAPSSDGGSTITHYLVFRTGTRVATLGSTTLSDTVTGLAGGTTYHFTVEAQNAIGTSPASGTLVIVTTPTTPTPPSPGYDLVGSDGGVFVLPTGNPGGFYGSLPSLGVHVNDIVGMVPTADDQGYFLVGADGGVFSFGNARFLGSLPGLGVTPAAPITGIVPTGTDGGYFLVGRDGGVYAFGNATFLGSLPGAEVHTNNIVGIAATPSGNGYWVVAATGTVYAFGAARQLGSATGTSSPVSAIAGTPTGGGYWIVTENGAVDAFGNANYFGSLPALGVNPAKPVIGVVHTSGTGGYWLVGSDGGIFAFGNAGFVGSLPGLGVNVSDIVGAVPTAG